MVLDLAGLHCGRLPKSSQPPPPLLFMLKRGSLISRFVCALYFILYYSLFMCIAVFMCFVFTALTYYLGWFTQLSTLLWSYSKGLEITWSCVTSTTKTQTQICHWHQRFRLRGDTDNMDSNSEMSFTLQIQTQKHCWLRIVRKTSRFLTVFSLNSWVILI